MSLQASSQTPSSNEAKYACHQHVITIIATKITAAQWFDFFHHFSLAQLGAVGLLEEPENKGVINDEWRE
jgi:hypothetical protein